MIYGYARVSSHKQILGNSIEEQVEALKNCNCDEIIEEEYTGTKTNRPKFTELLSKLQEGDTLVVTKLDRFARNANQGAILIKDLLKKGIKVRVVNMGMVDNTPVGRLILDIMMAFAEFERDMIIERTQAGLSIARTKDGFRMGRPPLRKERVYNAMLLLDQGYTYKEVEKMTGVSLTSLIRYRRKYKDAKALLEDDSFKQQDIDNLGKDVVYFIKELTQNKRQVN